MMREEVTATRRLEWDSAHRVLRHESKCGTIHGHRYAAELECAGVLDAVGRVIDFGVVKQIVGGWIDDTLDHTSLINSEDELFLNVAMHEHKKLGKRAPFIFDRQEPTAENIARMLIKKANELLTAHEIYVCRVRVYETPNCYAEVTYKPGPRASLSEQLYGERC